MIRVLLGQRGTLLRGALAAVLSQEDDMTVVAEVQRADEVLATAKQDRPDVLVLDFELPGSVSVVKLCGMLGRSLPGSAVLVLLDARASAGAGTELVRYAPRVGFIGTDTSPKELVDGIRRLARGEPVLDAKLAVAALTARVNPLTIREREVLRLALAGAPAKEIAASLFLSPGTVRNYLSRIIAKTGARTRIEAIRIAQEAGWI